MQPPQSWSLAHQNKHLVAVRGVITQSWELGYIDADTRQRARKANAEADQRKASKWPPDRSPDRFLKTGYMAIYSPSYLR